MPVPSPEQLKASDPALSAWVSANAGSGKTSVLVNRVVRLLLNGADPARILCVTYTKAAAANMQDRIFKRLGEWVALPDAALAQEIAEMDGKVPSAPALVVARRLFARAVETPGGLKIQTIHALCERLLHLFPFEAVVPARFEMLDEAQAMAAMERAMAGTLRQALGDPAGPMAAALRVVTDAAGEDGVRQALAECIRHRRGMDRRAPERKFANMTLRDVLGVRAGETSQAVGRLFFTKGLPSANWQEVADWLSGGTKTDVERAATMKKVCKAQGPADEDDYQLLFLTAKGEMRKSLATSAISKARPDLVEVMAKEQQRLFDLLDQLKAITAADNTEAIITLADAILARYEAEKRHLGRLDFQDLITRTRALLTSDAARWVLYKLDQGVDHILVDEAQDTSPEQWDIIKSLADEFFAGAGARGSVARTVFAVGDEKQSIFGFQGARPEEFDTARRHFAARIAAHNTAADRPHVFAPVELQTSYRTTDDVLSAVDQIFSLPENFAGLDSANQRTVHSTNRHNQPGLVELWPPAEPPDRPEKDPDAPVDARSPDSAPRQLADRIARRIRFWIDTQACLAADGKPITPGDVLVLVRNRGPVFESVIKALKQRNVPVAGADRMKLTEQLAVMDLLSLGRFCVLPEDDLALAETLKSPLIGLDEEQLRQVAHGRGDLTLWASLQAHSAEDAAFSTTTAQLENWRQMAATRDPLRFYSELLSATGLRKQLLARLGPDTAEALDVFLYRLRQWQAANPPALLLFLEAMQSDDSDVKRDMEEAHGRVRVMTIHASKGLEAPVVFMADLFRPATGSKPARLVEVEPGAPETAVWLPRKDDDPSVLAAGRAHLERLAAAEHRRLLYVGLTRARDRLYLAGARGAKKVKGTWHELITTALEADARLAVAPDEAGEGEVLRWRTVHVAPARPQAAEAPLVPHPVPAWLTKATHAELPRPPPLRPSRLTDAAESPPLRDGPARRGAARLRGDLIHLLLQQLPDVAPERRAVAGERLAAARYPAVGAELRAEALAAALALIADSRWADLFGPPSRAEVDIAGPITVGGREIAVAGRIDRLLVTPQRVLVADFKTGRAPRDPADVPVGYMRQMAVYRALAQDLYPDRPVGAAIIWTSLPALQMLDGAALDLALADIA